MKHPTRTLSLPVAIVLAVTLNLVHPPAAWAQPVVTTLPATAVTATNATLNGTVNPNGAVTTAYFRYGLTTNYGSLSATNSLAAGNTTLSVSNLIGSLTPGTTYHFQLVGVNSFGTDLGSALAFTTTPVPPMVTTLTASGVTATNATLNGTLTTGGLNTTAYFRYGLTTNYGSFSATNSLAATNTTLSVSSLLSSLAPGTTYHFQLVAANSAGAALGGDLTFTTPPLLPAVTTLAATSITMTSATLNGAVNPGNGVTTAYFRYGLTTNYGSFSATNNLAATNTTLSVSNLASSLAPGTTYHFQLVGINVVGTSVGLDMTFTTSAGAPSATTLATSGVTASNATLNGAVTTGGLNTTAYFRYGLTTNYGSFSATNTLAATNTALPVSNLISPLAQGSVYHVQLVVANSAGTALGGDTTFMTLALPPVVTTLPASSVTTTNATLHGTVNPNGGATTAYFQFGLTTNYGYLGGYTVLPPATNTSLTLPGFVAAIPGAAGANWPQSSAPGRMWYSVASSADGTRLAAVAAGVFGGIWTSPDSGLTWTQTSASAGNWRTIASSADGTRLAAGLSAGGIYVSTNSGATWTQASAPSAEWRCIAASSDGALLAAVAQGGGIYTSANSGFTWTQSSAPSMAWSGIASSGDGTRLAAVAAGVGTIHTSTNSGVTWTQSSAPIANWTSIASSADGTRLAAVNAISSFTSETIWTSTNSGVTWTQTSAPGGHFWFSIASSADGTRLAAAASGVLGGIWTSPDSGLTWTQSSAPSASWQTIASSADGTQLAAVVYNGGIYTSSGEAGDLASGGTVYHYRLVGINNAGTRMGSNLTFTTGPLAPLASTLAAGGLTGNSAVLNGAVNPNGAATTAYFRYGLTTNYGSFSATNSLPATNATLLVANLVESLAPVTTYHYQLVCGNSVGTSLGADRTFTTALPAAAVTTLVATGITATNATLNGTVNPNGAATTVYFQYGLTTDYGSYSATNSLPATNSTLSVSNQIGGLTPATAYHFRIVGINSGGLTLGGDLSFTTAPVAPTVTTLAATGVTGPNATLNGTVNPNGGATAAYFQYGLTTNYGSFSTTNSLAATNSTLSVSSPIGSLPPATVYHFRIVGINSGGLTLGDDLSFTTAPGAPAVTTLAASSVTGANATLNGTVNPNGAATTAYFQYGLTTGYGSYSATNGLPATNAILAITSLIGSLSPDTPYHFRLVASNSAGSALGADQVFGVRPHAFTGAEPGQGLDLQGAFVYAVNVGFNGAPGLIGDANFTDDAIAGVTITTPGGALNTINAWASPDFGVTPDALRLKQAMSSIRWTGAPGIFTVNLAGLQVGRSYQLQLLFIEGNGSSDRVFNVNVNGTTIVPSFRLLDYGPWGTAIVIPYVFTATGTNALIQLGGGTGGNDRNPILSAFTLESLAPAVTTLAASGVTGTNAMLNGTVNPNGDATTAYFQYGLTTNYGSYSATNHLAATTVNLSVSGLISSLLPGTTYHYQLVGRNSAGASLGSDLMFTTASSQPVSFNLKGSIQLPEGAYRLSFTNLSGLGFTVLGTTNLELPLSNWVVLGSPIEAPPGQYEFTDTQATNNTRRFYRVRSP